MTLEKPTPVRARDLRLGDYVIDPDGKTTVRIANVRHVADHSGVLIRCDFRMHPFRTTDVGLAPDTEVPVVIRAAEINMRQMVLFRLAPFLRELDFVP